MTRIRINRKQGLFEYGIVIMCVKVMLSYSAIVPYSDLLDNILTAAGCGLILLSFLLSLQSKQFLKWYCLILGAATYSAVISGDSILLITAVVCMSLKTANFDRIIRLCYTVQLPLFVLHTVVAVILAQLGGPELTMYSSSRDAYRYTFGFSHANTFSLYLFNLILLWSWLHFDKIKLSHIAIMFVISTISYCFTITRTSYLLSIGFYILLLAYLCSNRMRNWEMTVARFVFPACACITIASVLLYTSLNPLILLLNKLMNGRIWIGAYGYMKYGFTLLGKYVDYSATWDPFWQLTGFTFDNIYTYLAINQGVIWLLIISVLFYKITRKCDCRIAPFIIVWSLYGMTEVHVLNGFISFPIFLVAMLQGRNASSKIVKNTEQCSITNN